MRDFHIQKVTINNYRVDKSSIKKKAKIEYISKNKVPNRFRIQIQIYILYILKVNKLNISLCFVFLSSDAKCGKIQCHSAAKKPKDTNAVSIDTTIKTDGIEVKCRGTYVYTTQDGGHGDLPDPGLVMTGTKCGEGKVNQHPVPTEV